VACTAASAERKSRRNHSFFDFHFPSIHWILIIDDFYVIYVYIARISASKERYW